MRPDYLDLNQGLNQGEHSSPPLIGLVATIAALYFGREIFIPLAMAVLLTFALAPVVSGLRRLHVPRAAAVIAVVLGAFAAIVLFGIVVASQLGSLAGNLPQYQRNIETKMQSVKDANYGEGIYTQISKLLERLGHQIEEIPPPAAPGQPAAPAEAAPPPPLPVQVVEPAPQPLQLLRTIIGPLIQPLATGGIDVVVVIFMLLKREDLRDRFIRLVGAGDLHRTTEAIQDAGKRVGQYLLMQLGDLCDSHRHRPLDNRSSQRTALGGDGPGLPVCAVHRSGHLRHFSAGIGFGR
jgi:predicted PurR-regulated permease PerM